MTEFVHFRPKDGLKQPSIFRVYSTTHFPLGLACVPYLSDRMLFLHVIKKNSQTTVVPIGLFVLFVANEIAYHCHVKDC